jgi:hypothetical protein
MFDINQDFEYRASKRHDSPPRFSWSSEREEVDGWKGQSARFAAEVNKSFNTAFDNVRPELESSWPLSGESDGDSQIVSQSDFNQDNDLRSVLRSGLHRHKKIEHGELDASDIDAAPQFPHMSKLSPYCAHITVSGPDVNALAIKSEPMRPSHPSAPLSDFSPATIRRTARPPRQTVPFSFARPGAGRRDTAAGLGWTAGDLAGEQRVGPAADSDGSDSSTARRRLHESDLGRRVVEGLRHREEAVGWVGQGGRALQWHAGDEDGRPMLESGAREAEERRVAAEAGGHDTASLGPAPVPEDLAMEQVGGSVSDAL